MDTAGFDTGEASWTSYAHWVRDALGLMRSGSPGKIGLFESSVPEPSAMLADTIAAAFRNGPPGSYQSVFMRSNPDLVTRLSERYAVPRDQIHCTTGATSAIQLVYGALLERGERVLVERPGFDIFANYASDAGMEVGFFQRSAPDFSFPAEAVLEQLTERTRMVVLSNLHNPSGMAMAAHELAVLAAALDERGVFLVIDEVYADYAGGPAPGLDLKQHPNVIRIGSMTKIFGLSTLRCGWMFAAGKVMTRLKAHCDRTDFNVSRLSHAVAAEVLARAPAYDDWRGGHMEKARPVAETAFRDMIGAGIIEMALPVAGCICFPAIPGIDDTMTLSRWLIARHDVVVVPGECFGMSGHVRIGYALEETQLQKGLERLGAGLTEYREQRSKNQRIA